MDTLAQVVDGMTQPVYERLKKALELRRWPDGRELSERQLADTMQLVLAWEVRNLPVEERSGYMPDACRSKQAESPAASLIASSGEGNRDS